MFDTSHSLLQRLRLQGDAASWERFVSLYTPLIRDWLRRYFVQPADADDVTQEVLRAVFAALPRFEHNLHRGAFRRWLRTITVNRLRNFRRDGRTRRLAGGDPEPALARMEDPNSDLSRLWDEEHDRHVLRRLLELLEPEFEPTTWKAFRLLVLEALPTAEAAAQAGISPNAARIAKSRVLLRLRQEMAGLVD